MRPLAIARANTVTTWVDEHDDHHDRADAVDQAGALEAAQDARERRGPRPVGEDQRQARQRAADEA